LIAEAVEQAGKSIGEGVKNAVELRYKLKQLDLAGMQKITELMKLPPGKRQELLQDPTFRQGIVEAMAPAMFWKKGKKVPQEKLQQMHQAALSLGFPTQEETVALGKAQAETLKAQSEASLAKLKEGIATGVVSMTPANVLMAGDVKDPIAAKLFSLTDKKMLEDIALGEKKAGPLYVKQQTQDWYEKFSVAFGLPPGVAMQSAIAVANGQWDKVPETYRDPDTGKVVQVRSIAERQLAVNMFNAQSERQKVNLEFANSRARIAQEFADKAAIPYDAALLNANAALNGKPMPIQMPGMVNLAAMAQIERQQLIQKNAQQILESKSGIGMIRESLSALIATYKETSFGGLTGLMSSSQKADLEDKINTLTQDLTGRLAGMYGVPFKTYDENHPFAASVRQAASAVWQSGLSAGAYGIDEGSAFGKAMTEAIGKGLRKQQSSAVVGMFTPAEMYTPTKQLTQEQTDIIRNITKGIQQTVNSPNATDEQKKAMQDYFEQNVVPAINDPSKFIDLFKPKPPASLEQQQD